MTDHGGAASPRPLSYLREEAQEALDGGYSYVSTISPSEVLALLAAQEAPAPEPTMVGYGTKREAWEDGYDAGVVQGRHLAAQEAPAPEGLRSEASNLRDDIIRTVASARSFGGYYGRIMAVLDALAAAPPTPAEPPRPTHAYATSAAGSWYCCLPPGHEGDHGNYLHPDADLTGGPTCQALFPVRAEARPPEGLDVDRLARAFGAAWDNNNWAMTFGEPGFVLRDGGTLQDVVAEQVAAEYARLSAGGATKP